MSNSLYDKAVICIATYVPDTKAGGIMERQLKHCSTTADKLTAEDLKKLVMFITAAANLYITDAAKKEEFKNSLLRLAA